MATLQRSTELLVNQGEEFTFSTPMVDRDGTAIDPSGATAISLKAYEFTDSTTATVDITGSVDGQNLSFDFTASDTEDATPQTYIYNVTCTLGGLDYVVVKDNLTIMNVQRAS